MKSIKFDISKLEKLNHPGRLIEIDPKHIWGFIGGEDGQIIADIGAGTGLFSIEFSKLAPNSAILSLDISPIMIEWMNKHVCSRYPNIATMLMEESKMPLIDNSIDVAIMINLHHELIDVNAMLRECFRIIKPGGKIAISDWKKQEMPKGPPLEIRSDPKQVVNQLIEAGFRRAKGSHSLINNWLVVAQK